MRIILLLLFLNLIYPIHCGTLPDFSYWTHHLPSYESLTNILIPWTLEDHFFWIKYLPFYEGSSEPQKTWNFEDFQSEDVVPHIRVVFQLFGGFLSDPVGDPYVPPGHTRTREWCIGNVPSESIAPREKPIILQRFYNWKNAMVFGDDPPPVVPKKDPSECEIKLHARLINGVACVIMMSPLVLILSLAIVPVLSEREEEEEPSDSDEEPNTESPLTSTAEAKDTTKQSHIPEKENVLKDQEACKEPIYTPEIRVQESRRTPVLPNEERPGPTTASAPQDVKKTPRPKYNVAFSNIVWARSIPSDNMGCKAPSTNSHKERILVYQRQQPRTPEPRTPEPRLSVIHHKSVLRNVPSEPIASALHDVKESPKRKYNVAFSNIVWARSIPPDNIGRKAPSSNSHEERILVYQRQQPRTPEPRTPEPSTSEPRRTRARRRSFWGCLRGEED
ncbi:uncharacterized protein LOC142748417 isoform X2 [Rhinoderma darwinii]|uniref:uncharacterized protein LOC142748417 isoform X2 n=1 Tax=Rhinoderma darwinii TaxID=43563 RepID=UPI003F676E93